VSLSEHGSQDNTRGYEGQWERARNPGQVSPSAVQNLDGDWRVERLSGPVPMPFVWKRIREGRGTTRVSPSGPSSLGPGLPFRLEQREGHVALIYLGPLAFLVDELRMEADGSWLGRANVAGIRYAWFKLIPA